MTFSDRDPTPHNELRSLLHEWFFEQANCEFSLAQDLAIEWADRIIEEEALS